MQGLKKYNYKRSQPIITGKLHSVPYNYNMFDYKEE